MIRRHAKPANGLESGYSSDREKLRSPSTRTFPRSRPFARLGACLLISLACLLLYLVYTLEAELTLLYFKWRDHSYNRPSSSCQLRKQPLVWIRGDEEATVVWETTCLRPGMRLVYGESESEATVRHLTVPNDPMETHHIHQASLVGLMSDGRIAYSVIDTETDAVWAKGSFHWSPTAAFRVGFMADNQYNVRTFRRILQQMKRFYGKSPPALLVHGGDAVQNAYDLAMWQTDFSDPTHSALSFTSSGVPPLLWTPGNHDHDRTGSHPYTGGSPTHRALSIGPTRWIVLDSNDNKTSQVDFLRDQLDSFAWRSASLRIILVHISPFVEHWVSRKWAPQDENALEFKGSSWRAPIKEREWGRHIRDHLAPLWHAAEHPAHLVLSGHSHAYARGLLAHSAAPALLALHNSHGDDASAAVSAAKERHPTAAGTVYAIAGGAGGTLDYDHVEDWGFYESRVVGKHHWVDLLIEPAASLTREETYAMGDNANCQRADRLTWTARAIDGEIIDTFSMAGAICRRSV